MKGNLEQDDSSEDMSFEDESDKGGKKGTKPALAIDKIMKNMGK